MWSNPRFPANLVTFTEVILNGKLHFLCSDTFQACWLWIWMLSNLIRTKKCDLRLLKLMSIIQSRIYNRIVIVKILWDILKPEPIFWRGPNLTQLCPATMRDFWTLKKWEKLWRHKSRFFLEESKKSRLKLILHSFFSARFDE